jgi:hypothetical protein
MLSFEILCAQEGQRLLSASLEVCQRQLAKTGVAVEKLARRTSAENASRQDAL